MLAFSILPVSGLSGAADIVQPTGCILDQPHAPIEQLKCSANDILLTNPEVVPIDQCDFPGDDIALVSLSIDVTNNAGNRYDIGVWMSTDGDPNGDGSYTGMCASGSLPAPSAPSPDPHVDDGDMCGDVSKIDADPDLPSTSLGTVVLLCRDDDGDGFLDLPITVTWKPRAANDCADSTYAMPLNASKCSNSHANIPVPIPGQIIVEKETVPSGDATFFDFHIEGPTGTANLGVAFPGAVDFSLNGISPFNIWDSGQYAGGLTPGVYQVSEALASGWSTEVVCSSSKGGDIDPNAIDLRAAEVVHCTYTNGKISTGVHLIKLWKNGISGDKVLLTLRGDAQNPTDGFDQVDGLRTPATSMALAGGTVEFEEIFDPDVSIKYSTGFKCTPTHNKPVYNSGERTASLAIDQSDLSRDIVCVFLNTQVDTRITLSKVWVNGKSGDSVDLKIVGGSGSILEMEGFSTAPNNTVDATATVLAGDVITLFEDSTNGQLANYLTELECTGATNKLQYSSGRLSGKLTIHKDDVGKDIECTFTNTRKTVEVVLKKTWEYGQIGDTAVLNLGGLESLASSTATSTVITGATIEADAINQAKIAAYAGETVELNETLGPDGTFYNSEWVCRGLLITAPEQGTSGSFVVPFGAEDGATPGVTITCTFTNKRKPATLRLAKSWTNAFVSDKVDAHTTGLANNAMLHSVANAPTEVDYGVEVSVFAGETAMLSAETFDPLTAAANYTDKGWVCDGIDQTLGDGITIAPGDEGKLITCTIENTRKETTFTLNKAWVNARPGDVVELNADGTDMNGEVIATTSTAPTDSGASMVVYAGESITFSEAFTDATQVLDYSVAWECTDVTTTTNGTTLTGNTWVVEADPTAITCTFTNTGIPGQIIIEKATIPTGDATNFNFHISGPEGDASLGNPFPGNVNFSLNGVSPTIWDSAQFDGGLMPGQYNVSEDSTVGWDTEVVCSSSKGDVIDPNAINLRLAEIVSCTYTNTQISAAVILIKQWNNGISGNKVVLTLLGDAQNPTDGSSQNGGPATAATSTALAGDTVIFEEVFDPANASIKYSTEFKCTQSENSPDYNPGERTASLKIAQSDLGGYILCYFLNTEADTHVTLNKVWVDGAPGDSVDLSIGGGSGSVPATPGSSTAPDNTTAATSTALVGNVITLFEDFTLGQAANYSTELTCTGAINDIQYTPGQLFGELTIHEDDLGKDIHCTFTNTRKTATLRLAKSWINAFVSDKINAQTTGLINDAALQSEANSPTEIDQGDPVSIFVGETAILSDETFDPLAVAANYTDMGWVCDGLDQTPGDGITIAPGDEGNEITCTIENTRKTVEVILQKTWVLGQIGDTAVMNLKGLESLANSTATSTVMTIAVIEEDKTNQAKITAYAGEAVALDEILSPDGALYSSELTCAGLLNPDPTQGTSGNFVVPSDLADTPTPLAPITCTFINARETATFRLAKSWVNAFVSDKIDVHTTGLAKNPFLHSEANTPTEIDQGYAVTVLVGETAILSDETFDPLSAEANYTGMGWVCDGVDQTPGDGITIEPGDAGKEITCTIENTRKSALMTIDKSWVNAEISDAVRITGTSAYFGSKTGDSIANSHNETDSSVVTFTIYAGDVLKLSEVFTNGDAANYDISINPECSSSVPDTAEQNDLYGINDDSAAPNAQWTYVVPHDPEPERCTITNVGKFAQLTLLKIVELGEYYPAETDDFILTAAGNTDTISGTSGSDEVTNQFVLSGVYKFSETDAAGKDWLASGRFEASGAGWVCEGNSESVTNGPGLGEGTLELKARETVSCTITNEEKPNIPVTLSFVRISNETGRTVFEWETVTEINNAGFAFYFKSADGNWKAVDEGAFVLSRGAGTTVKRYRYEASSVIDAVSFSISDLNSNGFQKVNGPFALDEDFGNRTEIKATDWSSINQQNHRVRTEQKRLNKAKVLEKQQQKLKQMRTPVEKSNRSKILNEVGDDLSAIRLKRSPWFVSLLGALISPVHAATAPAASAVQLLNLEIGQDGLYRISHKQLMAQGIDLRGYNVSRIGLKSREGDVPLRVNEVAAGDSFGENSFVEFIGKTLNNLYVSSNIYTLAIGEEGSGYQIQAANEVIPTGPSQYSYQAESRYAPDLQYSYSSPHAVDPWYAGSLKRVPGSQAPEFEASLNVDHIAQNLFTVSSAAAAHEPYKRAQLHVNVWGASDIPDGGPDHRLRVDWNSQNITVTDFDGAVSKDIREELSDGSVVNGLNRIKLTLPDNGQIIDLVDVNEVVLTYPRRFVSIDGNALVFNSSGSKFTVTGFDTKVTSILRENADDSVDAIVNFTQNYCDTGWGCTVTFAGSGQAAKYYLSTDATLSPLSIDTPPAEVDLFDGEAEYIVIAHPLFVDELNRFAGFKSSLAVKYKGVDVVATDAIYAQYSNHVVEPEAIRSYIKDAASLRGTKVILLVGGDTYDYKNHLGFGAQSYLPSLYGPISLAETYLPLDSKYVDLDDDSIPDLAMGRLPVKTVGELRLLLEKRFQYMNRDYQNKALFVADRVHQGAYNFKNIANEDIRENFDGWDVEKAYLDDQSSHNTNTAILEAMNSGTSLVSYYGHSATGLWSTSSVLRAEDASLLNDTNPTIITQWGCWGSYYVEPEADAMALSFLMEGHGGAVTIAGAASQTSGAAEHDFANYFSALTTGEDALSMGEAILQAKRALASARPGNKDIVLAWALLGFPELKLQDSGI